MTIVAINIRALYKYLVRPVRWKNRIENGLQDAGPLERTEEGGEEIATVDDGKSERNEREDERNVCENSSTSSPP